MHSTYSSGAYAEYFFYKGSTVIIKNGPKCKELGWHFGVHSSGCRDMVVGEKRHMKHSMEPGSLKPEVSLVPRPTLAAADDYITATARNGVAVM